MVRADEVTIVLLVAVGAGLTTRELVIEADILPAADRVTDRAVRPIPPVVRFVSGRRSATRRPVYSFAAPPWAYRLSTLPSLRSNQTSIPSRAGNDFGLEPDEAEEALEGVPKGEGEANVGIGVSLAASPDMANAKRCLDAWIKRHPGYAKGKSIEDILLGVHQSIGSRSIGLLRRVGIVDEITFTGGVARNIGMVKTIEKQLGVHLNVSEESHYIGALGAALFAMEHIRVHRQPKGVQS